VLGFPTRHQGPDLLTIALETSSNFSMENLKRLEKYLKPKEEKQSGGRKSSKSGHGSRLRLNPAFVEILMGFPPWWTHPEPPDFAPLGTP